MGACLSCESSSNFSNSIRVVHMNGHVEDYDEPISASQVIGNPQKHFVCTSIQLLSSSSNQLKGDTQLQPGQVYFMLPYSILQSDVSPVDLASLAKRLTTIAKTRPSTHDYSNNNSNSKSIKLKGASDTLSSQISLWSDDPEGRGLVEEKIGLMKQPWKPMLDTIREKSFTRRSESDLQENGSLMSFTLRSESDLQEEHGSMMSFAKRSESDLQADDFVFARPWIKGTIKEEYM